MTYSRFEDIPVWKSAKQLAVGVYALTAEPALKGRGSFRDQLERAAVSVSNNIAEGFERGTTAELLAFLYISRGSAAEVRSMLMVLEDMPEGPGLLEPIARLKTLAESISRQLHRWCEYLQNAGMERTRSLNNKTRQAGQQARRWDEFMQGVRKIQDEAIHRDRPKGPPDSPADPQS